MSDSDSQEDHFGEESVKEQMAKLKAKDYGQGEEEEAKFSPELADLFDKVPPGEGDEFAAVKPWLGAIKPPKPEPKIKKKDKEPPKEKFEIDWVYGYRSEEARMNCQYNSEGHAVYPTAALGVVFDYKNMKQQYFGGGITDFGGRK